MDEITNENVKKKLKIILDNNENLHWVHILNYDKYGRCLINIYDKPDGICYNEEMLKNKNVK
jgi:hypothetical protein